VARPVATFNRNRPRAGCPKPGLIGYSRAMSRPYDSAKAALRRFYARRMDAPPILDPAAKFPHHTLFVAAWREIRDEAFAARLETMPRFHELMRAQTRISAADNKDWRMLLVKAYGIEIRANAAKMPTLTRLLDQCPEVTSATVSFLAPGKYIPPHTGPFPGIMRFHLGLHMPVGADGRPATIMTIAGRQYRFGDGQCLLWDDTYLHEVLNDSDEPRTALLLDVWRPGMPPSLERVSRAIAGGVRLAMRVKGPSYGA
jgi:aspartate beta-hydroxylase